MDIDLNTLPKGLQSPERIFLPPEGTRAIGYGIDPADKNSCFVFYFTREATEAERDCQGRRALAIDYLSIPDHVNAARAIKAALRYVALHDTSIAFYDGDVSFIYDEDHHMSTQQQVASRRDRATGDVYTATYERERNVDEGAECFFSYEPSYRSQFAYFDYRVVDWNVGMDMLQMNKQNGGLLKLVPEIKVRQLDIDWS